MCNALSKDQPTGASSGGWQGGNSPPPHVFWCLSAQSRTVMLVIPYPIIGWIPPPPQEVGISAGVAWSALRFRFHIGCIFCISTAPFYSSCVCCGPYTRAESVDGLPQLPLRLLARYVLVFHWLGLAALLCVALQLVVPPTMLALLLEEAVIVAGLHDKKLFLDFRQLGGSLVVMIGMASVISLRPAFGPAGYWSANARQSDSSQDI